jgi:hypothetical protein
MTAWGRVLTQYEDHKGLVDDLKLWGRAPAPEEIASWAAGTGCDGPNLLAHVPFSEARGRTIRDLIDPRFNLTLHRPSRTAWSTENRPIANQGAVWDSMSASLDFGWKRTVGIRPTAAARAGSH